ncbi:hypothetical protein [Streptomyces sp. NBC_01320]|uniref:hypothetical protein n=1 Tax=Streptomyces sp. NBC_01320 TaxID=2903824 RepID=UPI002E0E4966|nr:hypothetical protein OG395_36590 [Streptomyces sp. NBC_01320]
MIRFHGGIVTGVACNPAATADVLLRLLRSDAQDGWAWIADREGLPVEVVDALVDGPVPGVRCAVAYGPLPYRGLVHPGHHLVHPGVHRGDRPVPARQDPGLCCR